MPTVNLMFIYEISEPDKRFLICDLNEGGTFEDPLNLFSLPEYDKYNINSEGLYAIGGRINTDTLEESYKWGIFPWFPYKIREESEWYCPRNRFVIFPEKIHVSHSLKTFLNKNKYQLTINKAFREVIHHCRMVNDRDKDNMAWLGDRIEKCFINLHERGYAKSVELWEGEELIGGFYGFWYKGVFQGDSMFSLRPSASQIALVMFCRQNEIEGKKIKFIDTQFETKTFKRLGGEFIPYEQYRQIMDEY